MRGSKQLLHRIVMLLCLVGMCITPVAAQSLKAQNEALFQQLQRIHALSEAQMVALRKLFAAGRYIGQGNPAITEHPATPQACQSKLDNLSIRYENAEFENICGAKYMAPLYQPANEPAQEADVCIDQFEFPNIPCAYPVVWVRASEAAQICTIMGKRLCDAHEWEGACAGSLEAADYRFDLARGAKTGAAVKRMRYAHNAAHGADKAWSYGPSYQRGVCAASSHKSRACTGGDWATCGSNTFPAGHFPACRSALGVYDIHGNAAEHMNLPLNEQQMSSHGSTALGYTEMKGSWFIFDTYKAHDDWCRWRAPFWHGSRVMDGHSHHNYHLGFRCCKTIKGD